MFDEVLCLAARDYEATWIPGIIALTTESLLLIIFVASIIVASPKAIHRYINGSNRITRRSAVITSMVILLSILLATGHLGINLFLFMRRRHLSQGENGSVRKVCAPAHIFLVISFTTIVLLGDFLIVYRSFVIQTRGPGRNHRLFILQGVLLLLCTGASTATVNRLLLHDRETAARFILATYALSVALHLMCTGLLVGKIWRLNAHSRGAGLETAHPEASMLNLATPIWQGTLVYSSALVALIALFVTESLYYWCLQAVITPLIGLNCVLTYLRMDPLPLTERTTPLSLVGRIIPLSLSERIIPSSNL